MFCVLRLFGMRRKHVKVISGLKLGAHQALNVVSVELSRAVAQVISVRKECVESFVHLF